MLKCKNKNIANNIKVEKCVIYDFIFNDLIVNDYLSI